MHANSHIDTYARQKNLRMTCYVDDLTFSGRNISKATLYEIKGILIRNSLESHPDKENLYTKIGARLVTGTIVTPQRLALPNHKHQDIHKKGLELIELPNDGKKMKQLLSLAGKISAAAQSDPAFKKLAITISHEKKRIIKQIQQN